MSVLARFNRKESPGLQGPSDPLRPAPDAGRRVDGDTDAGVSRRRHTSPAMEPVVISYVTPYHIMELTDSAGSSVDPASLYSFEIDCTNDGGHDYNRTRELTCHFGTCRHRRCRKCRVDRIQYHIDLVPVPMLEASLNIERIGWTPVVKAGIRYCRVFIQSHRNASRHALVHGTRIYASHRGGSNTSVNRRWYRGTLT